jgi:hypothetical protein
MTENSRAISIRARLLNLARAQGADFQRLLVRFAIERLLYRLSVSPHADAFVLKGATLFSVWLGAPHRATRDLDLLGRGDADPSRLVAIFVEVVTVTCEDDGLTFDPTTITGGPIREAARYAGVRVVVPGALAGARLVVQIDIGLGDATVPPPQVVELPPLLDLPAARLRGYAPATVVAEKTEALVILGLNTSRMKDLYDLDQLSRSFSFGDELIDALQATFLRRGTPLPAALPIGLSDGFAADESKNAQWRAFIQKAGVTAPRPLADVVVDLRAWLWPALQQATARSRA